MILSRISLRFTLVTLLAAGGAFASGQTSPPAKPNPKTPAAAQSAAPKTVPAGEQQDLAAGDLRAIKKPPLPAFHPQQPKRIQLDNGMVIFLQEDHELPLIEGAITIRGGSKDEPADKIGLAGVYGSAWRTGGTKTHTGDQLDDALEARAAKLETSGGSLATFVTISCLRGDFDYLLDLTNDLLRNPEFRQDKIDIAKDGIRTGISRRNDNLGQIAGREATKIGYGAQSPYARVAEYSTVAAITRQDLLDWHAKHVQANNMIVAVVGDFDTAAMEAKLRSAFAGWPKGPDVPRTNVPIPPVKAGTYFVAKDDVNQSEIRMIAPGIRRDDPDFYAVSVMNEILGGGFASRLFSNLRTKAGLAYAVGGSVSAAYDHPGLTILTIGTKSGTTAQAIDGLYTEIDRMHSGGVTPAELQLGKDAILNSFVFEYDSNEKVMNARSNLEFHGYPPDFLERYQKGVESVTVADVNRVAKKYLDRNRFAVLVVGKAADFDKPLSTFGAVTALDVTIPKPGSPAGAVSAASNPEGKALLAKVIAAAGGAPKLESIKTIRRKSLLTLKAQGVTLETEQTEVGTDKMHVKLNTPGGEMIMVATGQGGFMSMAAMGAPRDLPSSQRSTFLQGLRYELWSVAQHANDPQYSFTAQGKEKVGSIDAAVLDISGGGDQLRWFVDPESGRVLRSQFQVDSPTGPATQVVDFSEWKTVDGISLPFHSELSANGEAAATVAVSSYEFNPAVDDKIFVRPEK
jgi:zinc protease